MEDTRPSSAPKYSASKETFELIDHRVTALSEDVGIAEKAYKFRYIEEMEKLQDRVHCLLQSYAEFKPEKEKHDPTMAKIPEKIQKSLKRLAMPPKNYVKGTLMQINQLLRATQQENPMYKNPLRQKRINELLQYRNQVCCLFSKYPKSQPSLTCCYKFASCCKKPMPMYAIEIKHRNRRIKSRWLDFVFDEDTNKLAAPTSRHVKEALEFHENLIARLTQQIKSESETRNQQKLQIVLKGLSKRRELLMKLKEAFETTRKMRKSADHDDAMTTNDTAKLLRGLFTGSLVEPFTNFLELPPRSKFNEALDVHKSLLLKEFEKEAQSILLMIIKMFNINVLL